MNGKPLGGSINVDLEKLSRRANIFLPVIFIASVYLSLRHSYYWSPLALTLFILNAHNIYYLYIQREHALLTNFGLMAQIRYILESIGPEFRQYLFLNDTEERPFNRVQRSEIYKKSKGDTNTEAFGSRKDHSYGEIKLRHSMYPKSEDTIEEFSLLIGHSRRVKKPYTLKNPFMISGMSYGSISSKAIRALARGAKKSGVIMNTGEGGFPKYHLMEDCDIIFQLGTGKFGARNDDATLNEEKLKEIAALDQIKMIELKFSQGAKPGKGGLLPKEKINDEIAKLRGVPKGKDVVSPAYHKECIDAPSTVTFIKRVQDLCGKPVGIKLCIGKVNEFESLIVEMKKQDCFPDYISIDGSEGGTGAAPVTFMDDVGTPIMQALPIVHSTLKRHQVRDKVRLFAAGKLTSPGKHFMALALGADAVYSARAFMLAIGCIQALQCNRNSCPVGIATHKKHLQRGLDVEVKSDRVQNFIEAMNKEHKELLVSLGKTSMHDLNESDILSHYKFHDT